MEQELTKPFTIRLQPNQRDQLRKYARETRTPESALVRQAIALFLSRVTTNSCDTTTESSK